MPTLRELIERQKKHEESEKAKPFFRFKLDIEEEARQTFKNLITKEVKIEVLAEIAQQLKILIAQGLKGESIKGDQGILGEKGERGDRGERGLMGLKGKDRLGSDISKNPLLEIDEKHVKNVENLEVRARERHAYLVELHGLEGISFIRKYTPALNSFYEKLFITK